MKNTCAASGDQRGNAICKPRNDPVTPAGSTIVFGTAPAVACWTYSFAVHQSSSPGGGAAVNAMRSPEGDQRYSYTYKPSGVSTCGTPPDTGTAATRCTCMS